MEQTGKISVTKLNGNNAQYVDDVLVHEQRVSLLLGEKKILETICSPGMLRELAYGHLLSNGRIHSPDEVTSVDVASNGRDIVVALADKPRPRSADLCVESRYTVRGEELLAAAHAGNSHGELFRSTGGTHLAAIFPDAAPSIVVEDISRTCALEKALGKALCAGVNFAQSLLFLTSRVPMGFVRTAAHAGIPILVAVSAPTYEAVREAERLGICLCGFARGDRFNVYSQSWRVGQ